MKMNCPPDSFQCKGGCISWDYVCDGSIQCEFGEDESVCGKCIKNTFKCLDGTDVSCELSCTILGYIPCTKYRNRVTCLRDYPDALGSYYKNSYNLAQSTVKSTNFYNSYIFYILVALVVIVLLIIGVTLFVIIYKKFFKRFNNNKNKTIDNKIKCDKNKNLFNNNHSTSQTSNDSCAKLTQDISSRNLSSNESLNKQNKIITYEFNSNNNNNDDDHKYHEINELTPSLSDLSNNDLTESIIIDNNNNNNNYYYANHDLRENHKQNQERLPPPPYNKIHMFKKFYKPVNSDKLSIKGKSTYV